MVMEINRIHRKAVEYFGHDLQMTVACEELAELIQAVSKYQRDKANPKCRDNIIEEIVDVGIMIGQIAEILQIKPVELESMKKFKLERLDKRIDGMRKKEIQIQEGSEEVLEKQNL